MSHTIQVGINFRFIENDRVAFNNLPNYSFSRNTLKGLGGDITADVTSYIAAKLRRWLSFRPEPT